MSLVFDQLQQHYSCLTAEIVAKLSSAQKRFSTSADDTEELAAIQRAVDKLFIDLDETLEKLNLSSRINDDDRKRCFNQVQHLKADAERLRAQARDTMSASYRKLARRDVGDDARSTSMLLSNEDGLYGESERSESDRLLDRDDFSSLRLQDDFACTPEVLFNLKRRQRFEGMALERTTEGFVGRVKKAAKTAIDTNSLIIACTSFSGSLLGTLFEFYYIKVFLTIYHLNDGWLNVVQILFAVWNAVNDPLFGYLQDVGFGCAPKWFMNRRKVILYIGPLYALSFMLFWIPWSATGDPPWVTGMHLLVALFLYDTMLTFAFSAQCGLFTESTTKHSSRVRVVVYLEMAGLMGGLAILPVDAISKSLSDFHSFQICTAVAAVVACVFLVITGLFASDKVAQTNQNVGDGRDTEDSFKGAFKASKDILTNRDFWCVVLGNFFHIMRTTGDANFLAILTEALLSPHGILTIGSWQLSLFYTGCSVLSKAFLVLSWPLLERFGAFVCLMMTLVLSAINCIVVAIVGRASYSWLAVYFLFENILSKGLWPAVFNLFFPDIIDEDMMKHKRKSPLSTLIFTMNALFTKPAYSIAPIIIVAMLNGSGYGRYLQVHKATPACNASSITGQWQSGTNCTAMNGTAVAGAASDSFEDLYSTMFYVACFYPLACVIMEAICFLPYRLKFRHHRDENALGNEIQCNALAKNA